MVDFPSYGLSLNSKSLYWLIFRRCNNVNITIYIYIYIYINCNHHYYYYYDKMQNSLSMFYQNLFQFSNLAFGHFNPLTFKFIQLKVFHQLLLYVMVNFSIF